jgi:hypothetical protein
MTDTLQLNNALEGGCPPATCSAWRTTLRDTAFGIMVDTGIREGPVIVLYRATHGWKTGEGWNAHVHLPHQVYAEKLQPIIDLRPREIVVVGLWTGKWVTIWSATPKEISFA